MPTGLFPDLIEIAVRQPRNTFRESTSKNEAIAYTHGQQRSRIRIYVFYFFSFFM